MDRYQLVEGIGVYFVTFTVVEWLPIFLEEQPVDILLDSISYCIQKKDLRICAYVVMPNHFHSVLFDANFDVNSLHSTLSNLRKFTGKKLADYVTNRFTKSIWHILFQQNVEDRTRRFWSPGWHAEGLFSEEFLNQKVNYIHWNPCRKGFVREPQDWRWSSAAYWLDGKTVDLPIADVLWG